MGEAEEAGEGVLGSRTRLQAAGFRPTADPWELVWSPPQGVKKPNPGSTISV